MVVVGGRGKGARWWESLTLGFQAGWSSKDGLQWIGDIQNANMRLVAMSDFNRPALRKRSGLRRLETHLDGGPETSDLGDLVMWS